MLHLSSSAHVVLVDGTQDRGEHRQGSAATGTGVCRWASHVQGDDVRPNHRTNQAPAAPRVIRTSRPWGLGSRQARGAKVDNAAPPG